MDAQGMFCVVEVAHLTHGELRKCAEGSENQGIEQQRESNPVVNCPRRPT